MQSADDLAVQGLFDRYLVDLDTESLDEAWARSLFTDDAVVEFPMSRHEGMSGLAEYHRSAMAKFCHTQHMGSSAVVRSAYPGATFRANVVSTQVYLDPNARRGGHAAERVFTTGTRVTGAARRLTIGWRLTSLRFDLVWTSGSPPAPASPTTSTATSPH